MPNELTGKDETRVEPEAGAEPKTEQAPVDWERAFVALAYLTLSGFVSSRQAAKLIETMRDQVDPRVAEIMARVFNESRSKNPWLQNFMG